MTNVAGGVVRGDGYVGDTRVGERARLGRRFVARIVDGWIVGVVGAVALGTTTRSPSIISIGASSMRSPSFAASSVGLWVGLMCLYETTFLVVCGATPGKRFVGVEVVDARTFGPLRRRQALLRGICWPLGFFVPLGLLVIWATTLADRRRRGVLDKVARTAAILPLGSTRVPIRSFLRVCALWVLVLAACTPIQLSRPGFGHSQSTSGVTSEAVGTGMVTRAAGADIAVELTPVRRGPLHLSVTDVTAPTGARFTVTGMDRHADGMITVRLRAQRCGVSALEQLVLHTRLGPLALQRTVALLTPVASPSC